MQHQPAEKFQCFKQDICHRLCHTWPFFFLRFTPFNLHSCLSNKTNCVVLARWNASISAPFLRGNQTVSHSHMNAAWNEELKTLIYVTCVISWTNPSSSVFFYTVSSLYLIVPGFIRVCGLHWWDYRNLAPLKLTFSFSQPTWEAWEAVGELSGCLNGSRRFPFLFHVRACRLLHLEAMWDRFKLRLVLPHHSICRVPLHRCNLFHLNPCHGSFYAVSWIFFFWMVRK